MKIKSTNTKSFGDRLPDSLKGKYKWLSDYMDGTNNVIKKAINEVYPHRSESFQKLQLFFNREKVCRKILEQMEPLVEKWVKEINGNLSRLKAEWLSVNGDDVDCLERIVYRLDEPKDNAEKHLIEEIRMYRLSKMYHEEALKQIKNANPNLLPLFF